MSPDATPLTPRPTVDLGVTSFARRRPGLVVLGLLLGTGVALGATQGWRELGQVSINGVVSGTYFALGAVGLTLIFGVLRLVNFAHGEFLTFGAYMLLLGNAIGGRPSSRSSSASCSQRSSGSSSKLRSGVPFGGNGSASSSFCSLRWDLPSSCETRSPSSPARRTERRAPTLHRRRPARRVPAGRQTELIVTVVGLVVIALVALALKYSSLGRQTRALADSIQLAETTGIDTDRVVLITWATSAALAGLAGILDALPAGVVNPNLGFSLILSIFAAVVVGGIGNAYGALAGGLLIGVAQEWSTLLSSIPR